MEDRAHTVIDFMEDTPGQETPEKIETTDGVAQTQVTYTPSPITFSKPSSAEGPLCLNRRKAGAGAELRCYLDSAVIYLGWVEATLFFYLKQCGTDS